MSDARLAEALKWALEWIDAVPKDTQLPAMPGFDRDYVDSLLSGGDRVVFPDHIGDGNKMVSEAEEIECDSCDGTGSMREGDEDSGFYVECLKCRGTGADSPVPPVQQQGAMREALSASNEELKALKEFLGPECDHDVNLCVCDLRRIIENNDAALSPTPTKGGM